MDEDEEPERDAEAAEDVNVTATPEPVPSLAAICVPGSPGRIITAAGLVVKLVGSSPTRAVGHTMAGDPVAGIAAGSGAAVVPASGAGCDMVNVVGCGVRSADGVAGSRVLAAVVEALVRDGARVGEGDVDGATEVGAG